MVIMFNNDCVELSVTLPLKERCKIIPLSRHRDERGCLTVLESNNDRFSYERVFWIHDVPHFTQQRGGHAHRTCKELLIPVSGSLTVELSNGQETADFHLSDASSGLLIPEYIWCRLYNFSENFVGLCFASQSYDPAGYIHRYEDFVQEVQLIKQQMKFI